MTESFDFKSIADEMGLEEEDILHLMTLYRTELAGDLGRLTDALDPPQWPPLKEQLHKMKGDAANMCLPTLSDRCAAMEKAVLGQDAPALLQLLVDFRQAAARFEEAFGAYAAANKP